ncbi:MAG: hypothetical protein WBJ84_10080 [Bacteroidales bacterium]
MRKSISYILLLYFSLAGLLSFADDPGVNVEGIIESESIQLGSQTKITLTITSPNDYFWQWPELIDRITDEIEIVHQSGIDTLKHGDNKMMQLKKELIITSFDTGYHAVPPLVFQFKAPGDEEWTPVETNPFLLYVAGVDLNPEAEIRDIKEIYKAPLTFKEMLPWILILLLVAGGIWLYIYYLKKKREKASLIPKPSKPKIPPHTQALNELDELREKKLWQTGRIKDYHSELTGIIRTYLEGRYNIMALEMTTSEIMEATDISTIPSEGRNKLLILFTRADLVKFAKSIPLPGEHEDSFSIAVDFVRSTIPSVIIPDIKLTDETQADNKNKVEQ